MAGPINYSIDIKNPFDDALKAVQSGLMLREQFQRQAEIDAQRSRRLKLQASVAKLASKEDRTAKDLEDFLIANPEYSQHYGDIYKNLNEAQKKSSFNSLASVYLPLVNGNKEMALKSLETQQEALKNSGKQNEANAVEAIKKIVNISPESAKLNLEASLYSLNPESFEKIKSSMIEEEKLGIDLEKLDIDKRKASVDERKLGLDQQRLAIENQRLALESVKNEGERRAREAQLRKSETELNAKEAELKSTYDTSKISLDRLNKYLAKDANGKYVYEGVISRATGLSTYNPATNLGETRDFKKTIEILKNDIGLLRSQMLKGSLSEKELAVAQKSLFNFDLNRPAEKVISELETIRSFYKKGLKSIASQIGDDTSINSQESSLPSKGQSQVSDILKKYPPK